MSNDKNDQALGTGAGAVAGALAGAAVGAPGGPVGMAVGAVAGGVIGAGAGGSLAQTANIEDYRAHLLRDYSGAEYSRGGREFSYYEPAYQFAFDQFEEFRGQPLERVEAGLRREWDAERESRPERATWEKARPAVEDGWRYLRDQAQAVAARGSDAGPAGLE